MGFHEMGGRTLAHGEPAQKVGAAEAAKLIARYPALSTRELNRAISLYRQLSALDTALMISDEQLAPKLDQFYKDNWRKLRTPLRHYALLLAIALGGIILAVWAGAKGMM